MAVPLLTVMLMISYICEGALLRKSTAADFLRPMREKRSPECFPEGCSTEDNESDELMETDSNTDKSSNLKYNGGVERGVNAIPGAEAMMDDGSGM